MCSTTVEASWSFCPNCNYWYGSLKDEGSAKAPTTAANVPSDGPTEAGCLASYLEGLGTPCGCIVGVPMLVLMLFGAFLAFVLVVAMLRFWETWAFLAVTGAIVCFFWLRKRNREHHGNA